MKRLESYKLNLERLLQPMIKFFCLLAIFCSNDVFAQDSSSSFIQGNDTIVVYKNVPGYNAVPARKLISDKYSIRIRSAATNNEWIDVFANYTYNRATEPEFNNPQSLRFGGQANWHYQTFISDWSHTYGNIEMSQNTDIEVEISFINGFMIKGQPIFKAAAHPSQKVSTQPTVVGGKIYFTISKPGQVAIDINGQFDDHHAAINPIPRVNGKAVPLHSISFYANPIMKKPSLIDPNVLVVEPGVMPSIALGSKKIMYFKPGVHNLGMNFKVFSNKSYYIPGDAVVLGSLNNSGGAIQGSVRSGENIKIYGYGTINGWGMSHPDDIPNKPVDYEDNIHAPIFITDGINVEINGITVSDPSHHSIKLQSWDQRPNKKTIETVCKWIKIVSWRTNGDGIGSAELVADSFIRTTDDASYIKGDRLRIVFWRDTKAAAFHMAAIPVIADTAPLRIEDCDVIYNRTRDAIFGDNSAVFQQRAGGFPSAQTIDLKIRNFRIDDKLANAPVISLKSFRPANPPEYGSSYTGIVFENIELNANSAIASPLFPGQNVVKQAMIGFDGAKWDGGITFDNVTFSGVLLTEANFATYFDLGGLGYPNANVKNLIFKNSVNYTLTVSPDDHGRISSNPGIDKYTIGTNVILTAIPNPGYEFSGWSGAATGTTNPVTIVMDGNKSISATFQKTSTFSFDTAGSGSWTVPDGVSSVILKSWGGGGAGGSTFNDATSTGNLRGGGGAGGSYASKIVSVTPGDVINFTVGKGGDGSLQGFAHLSDAEAGGNTFASINSQQVVQAVGGPGGKNIYINSGANGSGGVATGTGNNGTLVNLGGNGGSAGTGTAGTASGGGGGSAGADGAGGAGQVLTGGIAGAGGGAAGGNGTNSTTTLPFKGQAPGGGGAGSTIRINSASNTYKAGASGGSGKLIIMINDNLSTSDIDKMAYKYIYVYPNPVSDKLYVNAVGNSIDKLELVDLTGRILYSNTKANEVESIDLQGYTKGFYLVKIYTGGNVITKKISVK